MFSKRTKKHVMTLQHKAASSETGKASHQAQQDDRLMETLHQLSEGSGVTRELLNKLLAQYSWDGYLNELEFE